MLQEPIIHREIYILIRYSILSRRFAAGWTIGRNRSFEQYRDNLFSDRRLDFHYTLFDKLTAPSIDGAMRRCNTNVKVILVTSTTLPAIHKEKLNSQKRRYPWLDIVALDDDVDYARLFELKIQEDLESKYSGGAIYATIRMDDDDALSNDFLESVSFYMRPEFANFALSLSRGYTGYFEGGKITSFTERSSPKIAQGLAYIGFYDGRDKSIGVKTIFSLGNHTKIDEKVPVIVDARKPAYIWGVHEESDLSQENSRRTLSKLKGVPLSDIRKTFSISEDVLLHEEVDVIRK